MLNDYIPTVYNKLSEPVLQLVAACPSFRVCPELTDPAWVSMGLQRALHESATGRAFLQTHGPDLDFCPDFSHYFHTLKSDRRLHLLQEVNQLFARSLREDLTDELAVFPQLDNFDIYAGDGHWHEAASHDPIIDGKTRATGHFYVLDLEQAMGSKPYCLHIIDPQIGF